MWICKLDRDWLETPFLLQGFMVESMADIEVVAEHCQYVWVDAVEEHWVGNQRLQSASPAANKKNIFVNQVGFSEETNHVLGVYREARRITKSLLDEARLTSVINTRQAKETVNECVNSVLRNSDALMWLSKIRSQDEYTSEHCLNVCILAIAFGRQLGYTEEELHDIGICGLLHDVGKMRVPPEVLNKPGKLTPQEFKQIQRHTVYGRNLLMSAGSGAAQAVDVAWAHHERLDGSGYPRGLKDSNISRYARIIAIVDAFDAMTADRCYGRAMTSTEALKNIYRARGTQFDGELAEQFLKTIGLYPPGSLVELVNGEVGLVFETNQRYRQLPKIVLLRDANKAPINEKVLDLALVEQGKLSRDYLIRTVHPDGSFGVSVRAYQQQGLMFRHR